MFGFRKISLRMPFFVALSVISFSASARPTSNSLDFKGFLSIIKESKASTVGEAVQALSKAVPDYLKDRTAAYASRSIQESSYTEPRVIVFGPEARFIFTFNGSAQQKGGASIETVEFNSKTHRFDFREVIFKKEMSAANEDISSEDFSYEDGRILVSKVDPRKCQDCHGYYPTQPIWESYFNWPGIYGSNDDLLYGSFAKSLYADHGGYQYLKKLQYPRSLGRLVDLKKGAPDLELQGYLSFLKNNTNNDRYRYLPEQVFEPAFIQYLSGKRDIDDSDVVSKFYGSGSDERSGIRPNSYLLDRLLELNQLQIIDELKSLHFKEKWGRLDWATFANKFNEESFYQSDFLSHLEPFFESFVGRESYLKMVAKIGPFQNYFDQILREEFVQQTQKMQRMDQSFGGQVQVSDQWSDDLRLFSIAPLYQPRAFYRDFLGGQSLTKYQQIAALAETDDLVGNAVLGYMMKYEGAPLSDYALAFKRSLNFHDGDLTGVFGYLSSAD